MAKRGIMVTFDRTAVNLFVLKHDVVEVENKYAMWPVLDSGVVWQKNEQTK
jgi:hypothetical protein